MTLNPDGSGLQYEESVTSLLSFKVPWSPDATKLIQVRRNTAPGSSGQQLYTYDVKDGVNTKVADLEGVVSFAVSGSRRCER